MQTLRKYLVLLLVPAVFVVDRWTKVIIVKSLPYLEGIDVTSFFSIVHARNYGGVFGFLAQFEAAKYIFTVVPFIVMAVILFVLFRYPLAKSKMIALSLILSGAVGNMHDRIRYGYVVDFLDFYYGRYHWPAFNVADMAITGGIALWLYHELIVESRQRKGSLGDRGEKKDR